MSERLHRLDGWRGMAFWLMAVYHLLFDLSLFGFVRGDITSLAPMLFLERAAAWSFILCAGISSRLSHSCLRRGVIALLAGGGVTAVSYLIHMPIRFGILQFMGLSLLLCGALEKQIDRLPENIAPAVWLCLFCLCGMIFPCVVKVRWLFWLGLYHEGFLSYDYFPILPYIFLFLTGRAMEPVLRNGIRQPKRPLPGILTWPGKHSLLLYILHQPVLYGICYGIYKLI